MQGNIIGSFPLTSPVFQRLAYRSVETESSGTHDDANRLIHIVVLG